MRVYLRRSRSRFLYDGVLMSIFDTVNFSNAALSEGATRVRVTVAGINVQIERRMAVVIMTVLIPLLPRANIDKTREQTSH